MVIRGQVLNVICQSRPLGNFTTSPLTPYDNSTPNFLVQRSQPLLKVQVKGPMEIDLSSMVDVAINLFHLTSQKTSDHIMAWHNLLVFEGSPGISLLTSISNLVIYGANKTTYSSYSSVIRGPRFLVYSPLFLYPSPPRNP